jgi:cation/acetate symporter
LPRGKNAGEADLAPVGYVSRLPGGVEKTGPTGPFGFLRTMQESEVILWNSTRSRKPMGTTTRLLPKPHARQRLHGRLQPDVQEGPQREVVRQARLPVPMLALFCGTASTAAHPIRHTRSRPNLARKSTVVALRPLVFYVLTLFRLAR